MNKISGQPIIDDIVKIIKEESVFTLDVKFTFKLITHKGKSYIDIDKFIKLFENSNIEFIHVETDESYRIDNSVYREPDTLNFCFECPLYPIYNIFNRTYLTYGFIDSDIIDSIINDEMTPYENLYNFLTDTSKFLYGDNMCLAMILLISYYNGITIRSDHSIAIIDDCGCINESISDVCVYANMGHLGGYLNDIIKSSYMIINDSRNPCVLNSNNTRDNQYIIDLSANNLNGKDYTTIDTSDMKNKNITFLASDSIQCITWLFRILKCIQIIKRIND